MRGVTEIASGRFRARHWFNGKLRYLGYYDTEAAASAAYQAVAKPLPSGSQELKAHNIERVRAYLTANLGCSRKEVIHALNLDSRTIARAVRIIRGIQ